MVHGAYTLGVAPREGCGQGPCSKGVLGASLTAALTWVAEACGEDTWGSGVGVGNFNIQYVNFNFILLAVWS